MKLQFSIGLTSNPRTWPIIDGKIVVYKDKTLSLARLMKPAAGAPPATAPAAAAPPAPAPGPSPGPTFPVSIERVRLD